MAVIKARLFIFVFFNLFLCIFLLDSACADERFTTEELRQTREWTINGTLNIMETGIEKERVIKDTLIWVELTMEVGIGIKGEQMFEITRVNETDILLSRLEWPLRGEMLILKGEVGSSFSRFSLGGKFGTSRFRRKTNTDEDFDYWDWHNSEYKFITYQVSYQDSKSKVDFFDVNLYYNLMDWSPEDIGQIRKHQNKNIFDEFRVDKLSLDIFTGYQYIKGRYRMIDPMKELLRIVDGSSWEATGYPADIGLDSFYKVRYRGPRFGFRLRGASGKADVKLSVAYASLRTNGFGWWNRRDLTFWHSGGKRGYGIDATFEVTYPFTPSFYVGLGYNFLYCHQDKLKDTYMYPGYSHIDVDRARNIDLKVYGPSLVLKYIW